MPHRGLVLASLLAFLAPAAHAAPAYEQPPVLKASEILTAEELKGPRHRVRERVVVQDYLMRFEIESDYGLLTAPSRRMLATRIKEIDTLATAGRSNQAGEVFKGIENSVRRTGTETVAAIKDPFGTARRLPKGAYNQTLGRVSSLFGSSGDQSSYGDSWVASGLYGKQKRKIAGELKLDPYSTNPAVQQVLEQLGKSRAVGSWGVDLSSMALPSAVGYAQSAIDAQAEVKNVVLSNDPGDVDRLNDQKLAGLGILSYARQRFRASPWLSPTHKTVITTVAGKLKGVDDLEALVIAAAEAADEARAVFQTEQAVMLAAFHARQRPLARLDAVGGIVIAWTKGGHVVVMLPVDHGTFDAHTDRALQALVAMPNVKTAPSRTFYVTGRLSPTLAQVMKERGIRVFQGVRPPRAN